jgi:signal transduction histidine kinase
VSVAVPSSYAPFGNRRGIALLVGLGAAAAAAAGGTALAHGQARGTSTLLAATTIAAGCTFAAGGIVAWLRQPANRTGLLMIATGFLLFGSSLAQANRALPFTIGLVLGAAPAALLAHLVLAFPEGRLHSRWERLAVAGAYFDVMAMQVLMLMFMGFAHVNGGPYPSNLLLVRDDMRVHNAVMGSERALGFAVAVWVGFLLVRRWRAASLPLRRAVVPLFTAGGLVIALFAMAFIAASPTPTFSRAFSAADQIALATVPIAFLLGLFNARLARAGVSDLVLELARTPAPGRLRDALARALGDPSLELAYWIPESETYVGIDGRPIELQTGEGRAVTVLERGGRRVAALAHDPALGENQDLLDAVSSAAGLALENEQLQAELRAQLEELRDSRARIVEAGDSARRRLERNLHDGAQQRLVALSVALGLAETKLATDPNSATALLAAARAELAVGLEELREIARGLHPAILSRGLDVALAGIAERSPVPVDLHVDVNERPPEQIEAAAYYIVAEALTNVARYANATSATVSVTRDTEAVRVEVTDDGIGGAAISPGSGLQGLRDRVAAVGGRLDVLSPAGGGTQISALLPVGGRDRG